MNSLATFHLAETTPGILNQLGFILDLFIFLPIYLTSHVWQLWMTTAVRFAVQKVNSFTLLLLLRYFDWNTSFNFVSGTHASPAFPCHMVIPSDSHVTLLCWNREARAKLIGRSVKPDYLILKAQQLYLTETVLLFNFIYFKVTFTFFIGFTKRA